MFNRPRIAIALVLLLVFVLSSCADESPFSPSSEETLDDPTPTLSISDGAHGAGNEHFYFLAPLVKNPKTTGIFDPTRSPLVEICELVRGECLRTVATYTMDSGPESDRVRVNEKREEYWVEWNTASQRLPADMTLRIQVQIADTELGHLDVLLTAKKTKSTGDYVTLKAGSVVNISFRIEEGSTPPTGDIILHDNVVPVDSTVLTLVSTESELTAGTYRFDVIGSPVPDISAGDVLAGPQGLGFMRIVRSVKATGKRVVAETTQADLSDIIKEGGFSISAPLDLTGASPPPSGSAMDPLYYMAPGVSAADRLFTFTDVNLCGLGGCPEWLSLTLPSGYVDFTTSFDWDYETQFLTHPLDPLKLFRTTVKGDLVFDVTAKAVASQAFSADDDAVLVRIPVPITLPPILWFLKARADVKLIVGYEANAAVEARVQSGLHLESGFEVGGEYTYGNGWSAIWIPTFSVAAKETFWAAQGEGSIRVYVRPEVQLVVSGVEGPFAGVEPYLKAYGSVGTEGCRARLTWATDADVVLTAKVGKTQLPTLPWEWPGTETEILPNIPCSIGALKVVTTTSGTSPDPDGYTVTLDGIDPKPAALNSTVVYSPLPPTSYSVELTGLAENCSVTLNPRTINVTAGDTALVAFPVTCGEPETGILQVNTMTTGQDDGYTVTTDGSSPASQPIGTEGQVTFDPVLAGDRTVELTELGPNCTVAGDNPRTVNVAPSATSSTTFDVTCGLTVSVTTTGDDPDPDGYTVLLDSAPHPLADVNGTLWLDIAAGPYSVELTDVASECRVAGDNPRNVNSPGRMSFDVDCSAVAVKIAYVRSLDHDFNLWQANPDGSGVERLTSDGTSGGDYQWASWSPDGRHVAFGRQINCGTYVGDCTAIFVLTLDSSSLVQVSFPALGAHDQFPQWSHQGDRIVFGRYETLADQWATSIVTVNPDGSNPTAVLSAPNPPAYFEGPTWMPDGRILFAEMNFPGEGVCNTWISVVNADGAGLQRLTDDLGCEAARLPEVSPDGSRVVFWHNSNDMFAMDADGSNLENITSGAFDFVSSGVWSPDGFQIAFRGGIAGGGWAEVWVMNADGSNPVQVTTGEIVTSVDWRAVALP